MRAGDPKDFCTLGTRVFFQATTSADGAELYYYEAGNPFPLPSGTLVFTLWLSTGMLRMHSKAWLAIPVPFAHAEVANYR